MKKQILFAMLIACILPAFGEENEELVAEVITVQSENQESILDCPILTIEELSHIRDEIESSQGERKLIDIILSGLRINKNFFLNFNCGKTLNQFQDEATKIKRKLKKKYALIAARCDCEENKALVHQAQDKHMQEFDAHFSKIEDVFKEKMQNQE